MPSFATPITFAQAYAAADAIGGDAGKELRAWLDGLGGQQKDGGEEIIIITHPK